jgi:hypothetical protein
MALIAAAHDPAEAAQAQYLVCSHLVRACQQAIYDIAVDEEGDAAVRQQAIQTLKDILADWTAARRSLRREIRA